MIIHGILIELGNTLGTISITGGACERCCTQASARWCL